MPKVIWDVSPTLLLGEEAVRYYSLCMIATFFGGYALVSWQIKRGGGDVEEAGDFINYGVPAVVIGARLGHVLFYDFDRLLSDPSWFFKIWQGGLASHGALLGLATAMFLFTRRRAIPLLEGTDRLVFAGALGAGLIRLGNLLNSEIVGKPTDGSWGFAFPRYDHDVLIFRHPSQLYEMALAIAELGLLIVADRLWGKERRSRGALTGLFLSSFFAGRFALEFLKEPLEDAPYFLSMGQILSLPAVLVGLVILVWSFRSRSRAGWVVAS